MAKMFDKVSQDFLSAIKGVLEAKKVNKHGHDLPGEEDADIDNDGDTDKSDKYLHNRRKAIGKAMMKKESAEQIDELSTNTLRKYREKARDDAFDADAVDDERRLRKRSAGHNTAGKKIIKRGDTLRAEEAEQIDEISTKLALDYMDKASDARGHKNMSTAKQDKRYKSLALAHEKIRARRAKVATTEAVGDITVKSKSSADAYAQHTGQVKKKTSVPKDPKTGKTLYQKVTSEEAELTPEEIAMIEAKLAGVADGSMEGDKHMCATKVFHKEWNEGTPIKTMHADPDENGLIEWYDVMFDHGIERVMTEDMEILQAESHMHSKKMKKEEVGLEEGLMHDRYVRSHGKKAKGTGSWAFTTKQFGSPKEHEMHFTSGQKSLSDAHKEAAAKLGTKHLYVMEEVEELDELSKDTMLKYLSANKKSDAAAQEKGDYSKSVKRMRGTDVAVRKYTAKPGSKYVRVPATEEVELDEARGRPKKAAAKDYTINPRTKEKLMHDNPEHMKKIEKLVKNKVIEMPKTEAGQHIINQLRKASTSMTGGATVHFTHGESKHVSAAHAGKALDKYASMKPTEKEDFQKKIGHSHEQMMKHI